MHAILHWLSDLLWPARCLGCGHLGTALCAPCADRVPIRWQSRRPLGMRAIDQLIAATDLRTPPIEQAVWHLKYRNERDLAAALGSIIVRAVARAPGAERIFDDAVVVPVPLHPRRLRERGYNQAELLALPLAQAAAVPLVTGALVRTRATASQVATQSRTARLENMAGAFAVPRPELVAGKGVVLVDDVTTTGATLDEAALALKSAGAHRVVAVTLAHG